MLLAIILSLAPADQSAKEPITKEEFAIVVEKDNGCPNNRDSPGDSVLILDWEEYDFDGDGVDEVAMVATDCNGGTGGPIYHEILKRNSDGSISRTEAPEPPDDATSILFGNRNFGLSIEGDELVEIFNDTSGRANPLVVRYRWHNGKFELSSMAKAPRYETSYDCDKATGEPERAICYVQPLAALDRQLADVYKGRLERADEKTRVTLKEQQRNWLAERNKKCVVYKWWVECATEKYQKRIAQLEVTGSPH